MVDRQIEILLLDVALIFAVAKAAGFAARRMRQPAVIGEIIAGLAMGPTLLNGIIARTLFPTDIRPFLNALADLGLVLFMFLVGMRVEHAKPRGIGRVAGATAIGATALPFGLGVLLALWLVGHHDTTNRLGFTLFMGLAFSITAFPVLARIIEERDLSSTFIGTTALSCAAVCDVAAWTMLALVQGIASHSYATQWQVVLIAPLVAVMVGVVRPLLRRLFTPMGTPSALAISVVVVGILLSAAVTQLIGLHFVFGAFLFGLMMPRLPGTVLRDSVAQPVEFAATLLLPMYFVVTGLNVDLSGVGAGGVLDLCLIVAVAVVGKAGGAFGGARAAGLPIRQSAMLASLMNTRGLTELIALGVGLRAGLLDHRLYSAMVVMAVVTTAMCGPLLHLLTRPGRAEIDVFQKIDRHADLTWAASDSRPG